MKRFVLACVLGGAVWVAGGLAVGQESRARIESGRQGDPDPRPNILFFLVDDMGWQDCSVPFYHDEHGRPVVTELNRRYRTPQMEKLAASGMKFTNAYAMTVCSPTRVSLMTGKHPARHHVTQYIGPDGNNTGGAGSPDWRKHGLDAKDVLLPRLLSKAGYRTIHVGKGHLGSINRFGAKLENLGFDVVIAGNEIGRPGSYTGNYGQGGRRAVPDLEAFHDSGTHLTEALTLEMGRQIEKSVKEGVPFFAYMAHYAVHGPFQLDRRFEKNYPGLRKQDLNYATMIEGMDKSLGDLLAKINELGVGENTLVVFMSDNGSAKNRHSPPLRDKKGSCYEGGCRVPMLVSWAQANLGNPNQRKIPIPASSREDDLVIVYDWFTTLTALAGVDHGQEVDGYDLSPYLMGQEGEHRPQRMMVHFPHRHQSKHYSSMRDGDWKLIVHYMSGKKELYNLKQDLGEKNNLVDAHPERVERMTRDLAKELERMGAQYSLHAASGKPILPK